MVAPTVVGQRLANRYRVLRHLADGTTGAVYLAEDAATRGRVIVKVLIPELSFEERTIAFLQARLQRNMRLPRAPGSALDSIVDITDVGSLANDDLYVVMPLVGGESLAGLLARRGRLSWAQAKTPLIRIAEVIGAYHGEMIALGQAPALGTLQASNCYAMRGEGSEATIKIINSGIDEVVVRRMWREGGEHVRSLARYGAPELSAGEKVDLRADVYAVGVIMYELLSGRLPFDDPNVARLEAMHLMSPPPPLRELVPRGWVPPRVEAVIGRALAKKPEERFQGLGALVEALTRASTGPAAAASAAEDAVPRGSATLTRSGRQVRSGMVVRDPSGQERWPSERSGPMAVGASGGGAQPQVERPSPPPPPAAPPPAAAPKAQVAAPAAVERALSPLEEAAAEAVEAAREAEAERSATALRAHDVGPRASDGADKPRRTADTVITRRPLLVPEDGGAAGSGLRRRAEPGGSSTIRRGRSSVELGEAAAAEGVRAEGRPAGRSSAELEGPETDAATRRVSAGASASAAARPQAAPPAAAGSGAGARVDPRLGAAPVQAGSLDRSHGAGRAAAQAGPGAGGAVKGALLWSSLLAAVVVIGLFVSGVIRLPGPASGPVSAPPVNEPPRPAIAPLSAEAKIAEELLQQAKISEQSGDMKAAFRLASESYERARTTGALEVMGRSACRLGDVDMARWSYRHLPAGSQAVMRALCETAGVGLDP
jgi:hypothetical protein